MIITSKYLQFNISKTSTNKGVIYKGITLTNQVLNQQKIKNQNQFEQTKNQYNKIPIPINFESTDFQSNSNQSAQLINFHSLPITNQLNITQPITFLQSFEITTPTKIIST